MEIRTRAYKSSVVKSLLLDALQVAVGKPREEAEPLIMSAINKARKYSNYLPDKLRPHVVLGKDKTLGYEGVQAYLLELAKPIVGGKTTRRRTPRKNTRSSRKTRRRQHRK
jgi:hypothetical protein